MKKVYIVFGCRSYEGDQVIGVFSSRKKADAEEVRIENLIKNLDKTCNYDYALTEEYELK